MRSLVSIALVVLAVAGATAADPIKQCKSDDGEYVRVLDSYFAHARGSSSSAVVLRVYGGLLPEYEIVIDPSVSTHVVFRYTPKKAIWSNVYDGAFIGKHRTLADYSARAIMVPVVTPQFEIPESQLRDLVTMSKSVDTIACEHLPLHDSKGHDYLIEDAPWFEIIMDGGHTNAKVTDTSDSKEIVSQNPSLLQWAISLQNAIRVR